MGHSEGLDMVEVNLRSLSFLQMVRAEVAPRDMSGFHYAILALDFRNPQNLQATCRLMDEIDGAMCQRIAYFHFPVQPTKMQLLFAVEMGCRFFARGEERLDLLRRHLQSLVSNSGRLTDLQRCEEEMRRLSANGNTKGLAVLANEVAEIGKDSEEGLRLQVEIQRRLGKQSRVEPLLRKILMKYPENLWAANQLGKMLLRSGRSAEAIQVLSSLSFFHDMNSERLMTLGNACAESGLGVEAESAFRKAEKLDPTNERVHTGLVKAKLAQNDFEGLEFLAKAGEVNQDVISFLNMRAILATRSNDVEGAMRLYHFALAKSTRDEIVQAKLHFNIGLTHAKQRDYVRAVEALERSRKLGGVFFDRAANPLMVAKKLAAANRVKSSMAPKDIDEVLFDEIDWEQVDKQAKDELRQKP
jgi:tetratricopeptide (TPR) repeat protein